MAELYAMKEKLLLAGIVVCPTLEELYAALNSAKARLLGPTSLRIAMPQGRRSTVAGRAKKASPTTRKMQRRRSEAPDTYRLTVNVLSAKLREGSSRVYAWDASLTSARLTHARSPAALSPHSPSPLQLRARQVPRLRPLERGLLPPPAPLLTSHSAAPRLQAQTHRRQALGAHRVLRLAGARPPPPLPHPHISPRVLRLAVPWSSTSSTTSSSTNPSTWQCALCGNGSNTGDVRAPAPHRSSLTAPRYSPAAGV